MNQRQLHKLANDYAWDKWRESGLPKTATELYTLLYWFGEKVLETNKESRDASSNKTVSVPEGYDPDLAV